jgi:hypothetical protein
VIAQRAPACKCRPTGRDHFPDPDRGNVAAGRCQVSITRVHRDARWEQVDRIGGCNAERFLAAGRHLLARRIDQVVSGEVPPMPVLVRRAPAVDERRRWHMADEFAVRVEEL